ncbi:hypothetical protein CPAR01_05495 [Colletotrichum paranaense]|uniref:Secreted protein n=1 Tax=Colletotrichum paranaense TaxID=1914294 RepID=A0ABQ9SRJ0_9PEZI|nr:uncharacterized protein CPAR01_05495 [Colletotrichum paranaense]KAK1542108.1 hypothetical protein CPAR01_05495 [Colletotrichum paranaense]
MLTQTLLLLVLRVARSSLSKVTKGGKKVGDARQQTTLVGNVPLSTPPFAFGTWIPNRTYFPVGRQKFDLCLNRSCCLAGCIWRKRV